MAKPFVEKTYLGWEDAAKVDWKALKEQEGRKNWKERWGPGNPWWDRYEQWVDSGISRIMRKPSRRCLEWLAWQNGMVNETPAQGEVRTRKIKGGGKGGSSGGKSKTSGGTGESGEVNAGSGLKKVRSGESLRDLNNLKTDPLTTYHCRPCPYPITTYGEIGWLGQHRSCKLEVYGNDYMKKPPLPWYMPKIATYLSNSQ